MRKTPQEGLKEWETAERYARTTSERYPRNMWAGWFMFCERTGHGDLAAARAWTKEVSAAMLENPKLSEDDLLLCVYVQLLCGDKASTAGALRRFPKDVSKQVNVLSLAATSELAGATDMRDFALERFCTLFKKTAPKRARILQMIRDQIAAKKPGELDSKTLDDEFASFPDGGKPGAAFMVAAHLTANGRLDQARRYWLILADSKSQNLRWLVFAKSILRSTIRTSRRVKRRRARRSAPGTLRTISAAPRRSYLYSRLPRPARQPPHGAGS